MNNDNTFISRWSDFGMKYRGRWVPSNIYNENDVVWMDLGESSLGGETYFVCREEHIAENKDEIHTLLWGKYG